MEKTKRTPIGAIVFAIAASLLCLRALISEIVALCGREFVTIWYDVAFDSSKLIMLLAFAALAVFLIMKKDGLFIAAPLAVISLLNIIFFFDSFSQYEGYFDYASRFDSAVFVYDAIVIVVSTFMALSFLIVTAILAIYCIADKFNIAPIKEKVNLLIKIYKIAMTAFIIFAAIVVIVRFLTLIDYFFEYIDYLDESFVRQALFTCLFTIGACIVSIFGITSLKKFVFPEEDKKSINVNDTTSINCCDGYISMGAHVCLLLFTFGIWQYIWIYKATKYTNLAKGEEERNPTTKLLLCMFVPFYVIYWTYKTAKRIDSISNDRGIHSDIATLSLILALFIPFVAPIIMQSSINSACTCTPTGTTKTEDVNTEMAIADSLAKYKTLLDQGIITQEEFDAKKKQLLGL